MLISELFEKVRLALRDDNENDYPDPTMLSYFNRLKQDVLALLRFIQADMAISETTITGDGAAYEFELPDDFLAPVPKRVRPRSSVAATQNYYSADPMTHLDRSSPYLRRVPTNVGTPAAFSIRADLAGQKNYIMFDAIPAAGTLIDVAYFHTLADTALGDIANTQTPWLGVADEAFGRGLELLCREGLEFTGESRKLWEQKALAQLINVFGYRKLQEQSVEPSAWRGMGW